MNRNIFYLNRIIKIISPFTFQTFKIELNGEENELRELLATILEINPNSIKGLRDSYNNYYTLSSAVNNPHINTNPYNYYTVVIKDSSNTGNNNKNSSLLKSPTYSNLLKDDRINSLPNENNINYHTNFLNNTYNFFEDNNFNEENINTNNLNYYNNNLIKNHYFYEYLNFADDLYKKNYIDNNLIRKLKKLIIENNNEVLTIMSPYINLKSRKSYDEFAKKIIPIISARSPISEMDEDSSSYIESEKNKKNTKLSKQEKILEDIKKNFPKKDYSKLKKLLKSKNKKILHIIKHFQKNKDYNKLLSKLSKLVNSEGEKENIDKNDEISKKSNKIQKEINEKDIKKIVKIIINSLKNKGIDIYYIAKYDFQKLNNEEKISLFTKKFKLPIETILSEEDYKIPKKNMSLIKSYFSEYIAKKITKNFDENEIIIYESLLEQKEENNIIIKLYKDFLKHKNINELKNQIKQFIKETVENIEEEEGEEEEEDDDDEENEHNNEGKTLIKEENEEEEEDDEEGEEEEDEKDSKNDDNKSLSNKSSDNIIILKDDNKDRGADLLNNNYRKINNYYFNNNNNENSNKDNNNNNDNNNEKKDEQNLGLGFVVIKQKKPTKDELKESNDNNILKQNTNDSKQNESSLSTNNPNKKLNQFIQQIEHMKKIDDIKKPILEAINNKNKYIMDLFQKFQKNKLNLNPKSLLATYKQIKENPDTNNKDDIFKSLVKEVPNISQNVKEFLFYEFNNKNSELETFFNLYEAEKEKDDFIESIQMFLKKPMSVKLLENYNMSQAKKEIESKLSQNNKNENLENKSKEIIKIFEKYNLFSDIQNNIIKDSINKGDNMFSSIFQASFYDKDFDSLYENIIMALKKHSNKENKKK